MRHRGAFAWPLVAGWQDRSGAWRDGAPHCVLSLVELNRNSIDAGTRHGPDAVTQFASYPPALVRPSETKGERRVKWKCHMLRHDATQETRKPPEIVPGGFGDPYY